MNIQSEKMMHRPLFLNQHKKQKVDFFWEMYYNGFRHGANKSYVEPCDKGSVESSCDDSVAKNYTHFKEKVSDFLFQNHPYKSDFDSCSVHPCDIQALFSVEKLCLLHPKKKNNKWQKDSMVLDIFCMIFARTSVLSPKGNFLGTLPWCE